MHILSNLVCKSLSSAVCNYFYVHWLSLQFKILFLSFLVWFLLCILFVLLLYFFCSWLALFYLLLRQTHSLTHSSALLLILDSCFSVFRINTYVYVFAAVANRVWKRSCLACEILYFFTFLLFYFIFIIFYYFLFYIILHLFFSSALSSLDVVCAPLVLIPDSSLVFV